MKNVKITWEIEICIQGRWVWWNEYDSCAKSRLRFWKKKRPSEAMRLIKVTTTTTREVIPPALGKEKG
jgi:hypothetical protein